MAESNSTAADVTTEANTDLEESTNDDVTLEDMEVSFDESDDPEDQESDDEEQSETEDEDEEEESEDGDSETDTEKVEETEVDPEEQRKQHNREMAERRLKEKQERELAIKAQQDEYINAADPEDPRDLAVRQLQIDAYNNKIESNTNKLTSSYERAIKDFDILNDPSPEIQAELNQAIDLFQAANVTLDAYGNPSEVRGNLYDYLQIKADSIAKLTGIGAKRQQDGKERQKSKTLTPPSRAPKQPKVDPDVAGFDEEAERW